MRKCPLKKKKHNISTPLNELSKKPQILEKSSRIMLKKQIF